MEEMHRARWGSAVGGELSCPFWLCQHPNVFTNLNTLNLVIFGVL